MAYTYDTTKAIKIIIIQVEKRDLASMREAMPVINDHLGQGWKIKGDYPFDSDGKCVLYHPEPITLI